MRIWGKLVKDRHLLKDMTVEDNSGDTRTHKIFHALDEICTAWDLSRPIWLDGNIDDMKRHRKTRFTADSFIEEIDFDYLEFQILEE